MPMTSVCSAVSAAAARAFGNQGACRLGRARATCALPTQLAMPGHSSLRLPRFPWVSFRDCTTEEIERGRQALSTLGLGGVADQPLLELSEGAQRLVLLVRALVANPELLVLDEPCQGLDAVHTRQVTSAVDRVAREGRACIIYVTHHEEEIPSCITRVLRLKAGRVFVWEGEPG